MKIFTNIKDIKKEVRQIRKKKLTIGFVPTMGALHQGHLTLMKQAKEKNDLVIISIFVNPLQFGPNEDFQSYPRNLKNDTRLARNAGVDIIFAPPVKEMYHNARTFIDMPNLTDKLCGKSRPGHFRGVMTVVTKLFNIIQPNIAYFGQKDFQQALIIKKMAQDLDMNLEVKILSTIRETGGLAMSSRNKYLNITQRLHANKIYHSLLKAQELIISGDKNYNKIIRRIRSTIKTIPKSRIDYIKIINPETLEDMKWAENKKILVAIAVYVGKTRLIDNIIV